MHPLFLHNNDHPGLILVGKQLTGSNNYSSWSRKMHIALSVKNKISLIDGSFVVPPKSSNLYALWARANDMVISWIFNVVTEEIGNSLSFITSAHTIWKQLNARFASVDGHRIFQLEKDLNRLEQGDSSVEFYFHKLKGYWDESVALDNIDACSCECNCGAKREFGQREERKQLMQFLMRLHESFSHVRGEILRKRPLPDVDQAFYMVKQEESVRTKYIPPHTMMAANVVQGMMRCDGIVAATYKGNGNRNSNFKKGIICNYYNKEGHVKNECYRLHGFPPGYINSKGKHSAGITNNSNTGAPVSRTN